MECLSSVKVSYMTNNQSNEYVIAVLSDGQILAIDHKQNIRRVRNFLLHLIYFPNGLADEVNKSISFNNFRIFGSAKMDKIVVTNEENCIVWTLNERLDEKEQLEMSGTCFNLDLAEERRKSIKENAKYISGFSSFFGNSYYRGNFCLIYYVTLVETSKEDVCQANLTEFEFTYTSTSKVKFPSEISSVEHNNSVDLSKNISRNIYSFPVPFSVEPCASSCHLNSQFATCR